MKDFYAELDRCLRRLELHKYPERSLDWCADRVAWLNKWHKIPEEQIDALVERIIALYESGENV